MSFVCLHVVNKTSDAMPIIFGYNSDKGKLGLWEERLDMYINTIYP